MLNKAEERMLVIAREILKRNQEVCVCHALARAHYLLTGSWAYRDDTPYGHALNRLRKYIWNAIDWNTYLEDWQDEHNIPRGLRMSRQQRQTRVDWVSWMLGEL